jgi:ATP-dependent DNA helicase PIF1
MLLLSGRGKNNYNNGIGLKIFFLSTYILQNRYFRCGFPSAPLSSVECFSTMPTSTTTMTHHSIFATGINNNNNNNNNHLLKKSVLALEMTQSDDEDDDEEEEAYNEEDDEDFLIFEEHLRNDNPEKRIMERNKKHNNGVTMSKDPLSASSSSSSEKIRSNDDNNDSTVDDTMLSDEQAQALNCIREGRNVFVTGVAGTGKSLVLKKALEYIENNYENDEYVAVAPTGSTAIALEGQTMHSFAGIGVPKIYTDFSKTKSNKKTAKKWKSLKILVLDEVSMVSGEFFDSLSVIVSDIRNDPRPFGGIQLVVCGDFLQLSPIAPRRGEVEQMTLALQEKEGLDNPQDARDWLFLNRGFCFQSLAWNESNFDFVELQHVFRQSNRDFVRILQDIRIGNVNDETVRYLREKCERPLPPNEFGIRPTVLHSKNVNVDRDNSIDLNKLPGESVSYSALDQVEVEKGSGPWVKKQLQGNSFFSACIAEQDLQLKIGAQVMLIKNLNQNSRLANGSRGKVIGFRTVKNSASSDDNLLPGVDKYPVVQFKNGLQQVIKPQKFQSRLLGMGICTRTAIPLKLAWAITTHKAQGLTLDYVIADVGQVFAEAQLYVALSRASDESGLELRNFSKNRVKTNQLALRFHQDPKQQYPYWWDADGSKPMIMTMQSDDTKKKNKSTTMKRTGASKRRSDELSNDIEQNETHYVPLFGRKGQSRNSRSDELSNDIRQNDTQYVPIERNGQSRNSRSDELSSAVFDKYNLQKRTVVELKNLLRERNMKLSGKKVELIERLVTRGQ